jgi:hypothetical protein
LSDELVDADEFKLNVLGLKAGDAGVEVTGNPRGLLSAKAISFL